MIKLDYYRRMLATGWCFLHFFVGGFLLALIVFPLLRLLPGDDLTCARRSRRVVRVCFSQFVWQMQFLGAIAVDFKAIERLKKAESCIVIANHPTLIDVILLMSVTPNANCIVKSALWDSPFLGGVMRAAQYISNSNDPEALLNDCKEAIARKEVLIIFPEGTRTMDIKRLKLQRGAAHIVLHTQAPMLPVRISCEPLTLRKGEPWYKVPDSVKPQFTVEDQPMLHAEDLIEGDLMPSQASRRLTASLTNYFQQAS